MTKKSVEKSIQSLRNRRDNIKSKISTTTLQKFNTILSYYEDRKNSRKETADKLINGILAKDDKELKKGLKEYDKAVAKYEDAKPIGERTNVQQATKKATKARKQQAISVRLRKKTSPEDLARASKTITRIARKRLLQNRKTYAIQYMLFSLENKSGTKRASFTEDGRKYYSLLVNPSVRNANILSPVWIEEMLKVKVLKHGNLPLFRRMMMTLRTDKEFQRMTEHETFYNYIDAIRIEKIDLLESDDIDFDVFADELRDAKHNVSIYHRYIQTELNPDCLTLKEALKKNNHIENECWINTLTDHYADTLMREKKAHNGKQLTREKILKIINKTDEQFKRQGACIHIMDNVFKDFNIKARLYDIDSNLIYKHDPVDYNSMRIITFNDLVKNSHIYTLNHNLNSLKRREAPENNYSVKCHQHYYINDRKEAMKYTMINDITDVLQLKEKDEYKIILKDNNLNKAICQLKQIGYEPQIRYNAGKTTEFTMSLSHLIDKEKKKYKEVKYIITTQHLDTDNINEDIAVDTEDKYNKVSEEMFKFHKKLFTENHKSYYTDLDVEILDECRTIVPYGRFKHLVKDTELCSIDKRKAFSKSASDIVKVPVFKEFDVWKPYGDKSDVNRYGDYTLYLVKACQGNIFFNKKFNLVYGKHLKQLISRGVVVKILFYKKPSHIHKVKYKRAIDDLYRANMSDDREEDNKIKKTLANIAFGMLEKSFNRKTVSRMFDGIKEALHHQKKYGGKIYVMDEVEMEKYWEWRELDDNWTIGFEDGEPHFQHKYGGISYSHFDYKIEDGKTYWHYKDEDYQKHKQINTNSKYYIVSKTGERKMTNGFRYIKELLLQNHNFDMYESYEKLKANNINVYAVKSDAFHIAQKDVRKAKKVLNFGCEIGSWRVESNKVNHISQRYSWRHNEIPAIPVYKSEREEVFDEWDVQAICEKIIRRKRMMLRAKYAGSGKSFIGKHLQKMGYETLFVVPQNMLKQEIDCDAETLNKFFSIPVFKGDSLPPYDYSGYKVIVFDEIYMASPYILNKIRAFCENNPNLIIIGAGDVKQLPSIEPYTNCQNVEEYVDSCIDIIFKHNIFLKICKRVGDKDTEEGERNRKKLDEMYDDWWVKKMDVEEWILKHFKMTRDVMTSENNIAYTNMRCQAVSAEVRRRLDKKDKYEVGEMLICRLYRNEDDEGKFNVNIRWLITKVEGNMITIQDIKDKDDVRRVKENIIDKHFRYAYCATCHSRQGQSISGNITIHEWQKSYLVSREWLWCAITRARDFNNVYFFKNEKADEEMQKNLVIGYFKNKVEGYKKQDKVAGREIDEENYIDEQWCLNHFHGCCAHCGVKFFIEMKAGKLSTNMTAQRQDNTICHSVDNCTPYCKYCNCSAH